MTRLGLPRPPPAPGIARVARTSISRHAAHIPSSTSMPSALRLTLTSSVALGAVALLAAWFTRMVFEQRKKKTRLLQNDNADFLTPKKEIRHYVIPSVSYEQDMLAFESFNLSCTWVCVCVTMCLYNVPFCEFGLCACRGSHPVDGCIKGASSLLR